MLEEVRVNERRSHVVQCQSTKCALLLLSYVWQAASNARKSSSIEGPHGMVHVACGYPMQVACLALRELL